MNREKLHPVRWLGAGVAVLGMTATLVAAAPEQTEFGRQDVGVIAPQSADVEVLITENKIEMPVSLEAGAITFVVKNGGTEAHNLQITKGEWKVMLEENIEPGTTGHLTATLQAGTYEVSDPISEDIEKVQLRVAPPTR